MILLDTHIWVNWILKGDAALATAVVDAMQAELRTQMEIAYRVGYIDQKVYADTEEKSIEIEKMLGGLIKARSPKQ